MFKFENIFRKPSKKELPTGTGRESEPKETLPAIEVDNEVIWVNKDFKDLPLNIKEGESTKLGLFLTSKPKEKDETFDLKVAAGHRRSALLGKAIFKDRQNRYYRDIDLKGVGCIDGTKMGKIGIKEEKEAYGIFNLGHAWHTVNMTEKFLKAGIRTERYIALIKLNEIIDENGEKVSIDEAIKREMIPSNVKPGIALRALGTKFRVCDISADTFSWLSLQEKLLLISQRLEDARELVKQELGLEEKDFSLEDYLKWFAKTSGKNLGLMHNNKWSHGYLSNHNITLDGRIIDLDSVKDIRKLNKRKKRNKMARDYDMMDETLTFLKVYYRQSGVGRENAPSLVEIFSEAYKQTIKHKPEFIKERPF